MSMPIFILKKQIFQGMIISHLKKNRCWNILILFYSISWKFAPPNNIKVVVTCDHSTPCKFKSHSADPVPVLYYDGLEKVPKAKKFCEKEAQIGNFGGMNGDMLLKKAGFVK